MASGKLVLPKNLLCLIILDIYKLVKKRLSNKSQVTIIFKLQWESSISNKVSRNDRFHFLAEEFFSIQIDLKLIDEPERVDVGRHDVRRRNVDLLTTRRVGGEVLKLELVSDVGLGAQGSIDAFDGVDQVRVLVHDDVLVLEVLSAAVVDRHEALGLIR